VTVRARALSLGLALAAGPAGCWVARGDARIAPGLRGGATTLVMATPDATTYTPDAAVIGVPEHYDAAPVRALVVPFVAHGWRRLEVRLHGPALALTSRSDEADGDQRARVLPTVDLEVYAKLVERDGWHAGAGAESALALYGVVTRAWSRRAATSATVRGVWGGLEGTRSDRRFNTGLQLQLAYVHTGAAMTWSAVIGTVLHLGAGTGNYLDAAPGQGGNQTTFRDAAYLGLGVDWR
jgi:hypothetical protein